MRLSYLNVIEQYKKNQADVIFGLCYPYALAPVARLAPMF
jgi:hypothetical protein